jgi:hypothetical protein
LVCAAFPLDQSDCTTTTESVSSFRGGQVNAELIIQTIIKSYNTEGVVPYQNTEGVAISIINPTEGWIPFGYFLFFLFFFFLFFFGSFFFSFFVFSFFSLLAYLIDPPYFRKVRLSLARERTL